MDRSYARQSVGRYVQTHGWIEESHDARPRSGERSYEILVFWNLRVSCEEVMAKESNTVLTLLTALCFSRSR